MRLLYPSDPFDKKKPDAVYEEEFNAAQAAGLTCSLYLVEDFQLGEFKPRPTLVAGEKVIYRGWMLTPEDYASLHSAIEAKGGVMLTSSEQYRRCHYLPEWYHLCEDVTPRTIFLAKNADFSSALSNLGWQAYFVKDYVKSLTTSRGSVAINIEEIAEIIALLEKYRGQIEGGICVREFEDLRPESEERYFVVGGTVFAREGAAPDMARQIASRIDSQFFSIDIVLANDGTPRLIELGDGQVSDRKKWPAVRFVEIFGELA